MANLILGPMLRYVGPSEATVWVETDTPCEVEVLVGGSGHRAPTFAVGGHHYAIVRVTALEPGSSYEYVVKLNGKEVWPEPGYNFPASTIRTLSPDGKLTFAYGSCRVSVPHEKPYTLRRGKFSPSGGVRGRRFERDALHVLALRMISEARARWPDALVLLGDQVYADEVSMGCREFIRSRRDTKQSPGEEVADFEEYTHLYWDSWKDPAIRWLLSTIPSVMIFDDHDVHDDWNTSEAWVRQMRKEPWWEERIVGAFMSYWIYQHLGNLSPEELEEDELFAQVQEAKDPTRVLREYAYQADRDVRLARWCFHRDFGRVRLLMIDARAARVLEERNRSMLDDEEWAWIEEKATGDFDHFLLGTSLPLFLSPGLHHLEAASEAVCRGAWGRLAARLGESIRQKLDLEHWAAFHDSFENLVELLRSVAFGERSEGRPPASIVVLSGDVHHGYLAEISFGDGAQKSPLYQSAGSPLRNPLSLPERSSLGAGWTRLGELVGKTLARLAGVEEPPLRWRLMHEKPWFDNHVSTLELRGRQVTLKVEKTIPEDAGERQLYTLLEQRLA
ncbi:MAG: alkaline phosphatase family protein [Actinomycetota bacterium]|nr:alkaline phosphatase family protein [Actinomycetota bacterium]